MFSVTGHPALNISTMSHHVHLCLIASSPWPTLLFWLSAHIIIRKLTAVFQQKEETSFTYRRLHNQQVLKKNGSCVPSILNKAFLRFWDLPDSSVSGYWSTCTTVLENQSFCSSFLDTQSSCSSVLDNPSIRYSVPQTLPPCFSVPDHWSSCDIAP